MPTHRPNDLDQRFAYLDSIGRRCVGNSGHCINTAVDEFDVLPVVDGCPLYSHPLTTLKTCGRHRLQVAGNANWHVEAHRKSRLANTSPQRPHAA